MKDLDRTPTQLPGDPSNCCGATGDSPEFWHFAGGLYSVYFTRVSTLALKITHNYMKYSLYFDMHRMHGAVVILSLVQYSKLSILRLC